MPTCVGQEEGKELCVATSEGFDRSIVLGIGSTEHLSVALLLTQVVGFDLLLILCFGRSGCLCFVTAVTTPTGLGSILALQILKRVLEVRRIHHVQVLSSRIPILNNDDMATQEDFKSQ